MGLSAADKDREEEIDLLICSIFFVQVAVAVLFFVFLWILVDLLGDEESVSQIFWARNTR